MHCQVSTNRERLEDFREMSAIGNELYASQGHIFCSVLLIIGAVDYNDTEREKILAMSTVVAI